MYLSWKFAILLAITDMLIIRCMAHSSFVFVGFSSSIQEDKLDNLRLQLVECILVVEQGDVEASNKENGVGEDLKPCVSDGRGHVKANMQT